MSDYTLFFRDAAFGRGMMSVGVTGVCSCNAPGANSHTVSFDDNTERTLKLRDMKWWRHIRQFGVHDIGRLPAHPDSDFNSPMFYRVTVDYCHTSATQDPMSDDLTKLERCAL